MLHANSVRKVFRRRVSIGRRTYSFGALLIIGGIVALAGGGAVYARLGGATNPSSASSIDLQKGLVGWWKMDGDVKDSTPYSAVMTNSGTTATTDRKGKTNAAMVFDGNTSSLSTPDAPQYDSGSLTVSFWLNLSADPECDANNNWRSLASKTASNSNATAGWDIILEQNRNLHFDIGYGGVTHRSAAVGAGIAVGVPILLTFTYDASTGVQNVYANGVLKSTSTFAATPITANTTAVSMSNGSNIGCPNTNGHVPGSYDDFRLYNRALSDTETKALADSYDAGIKAAGGESGLLGWWKLDGNLKDSTPNSNNATTSTAITYAADRKNGTNDAASLNGTTSLARLNASTAYKPTTTLSVSLWFNANSINSTAEQKIISTTEVGGYTMFITGSTTDICSTNMLGFVVYIGGAYRGACYAKSNLSSATWYHVVGTYDGAALKLYVNNALVATTSIAGVIQESAPTVPLCIGVEANGTVCSTQNFGGLVDDLRVYSRPLSATDVTNMYQSYNSQINLNTSPTSVQSNNFNRGLVGYWPFNGDAKDVTPYAQNGTLVAAPSLTADRKGRANSAYSFVEASCQSVSVADTANLRLNGSFSVGFWLRDNGSATAFPGIVSKGLPGTTGSGWNIFYRSATHSISYKRDNVEVISASSNVVTTSWRLFVLTYDGTNVNWYVDGSSQGSTAKTYVTNTGTQIVQIGAQGSNCSSSSIDDVRIWNRAITQSEVTALYASYR
jgi:hypothetical protein